MTDSLEQLRRNLSTRLSQLQNQVKTFYGLWRTAHELKKVEPVASALLSLSIRALDLYEATNLVVLALEEKDSEENEFISQSSCRVLVLRAFEQREALFRAKKKIEFWANEDQFSIDLDSLDDACKRNKDDLSYIGKLGKIRNEVGHYNDDHLRIINYIEKIDVAKVVNSSKGLFDCYSVLLDLYNELLIKKLEMVSLQDPKEIVLIQAGANAPNGTHRH